MINNIINNDIQIIVNNYGKHFVITINNLNEFCTCDDWSCLIEKKVARKHKIINPSIVKLITRMSSDYYRVES